MHLLSIQHRRLASRPCLASLLAVLAAALLRATAADATAFGESGDVCIQHYLPSASCTGNELQVDSVVAQQVVDGCTDTADTATVRLDVAISTTGTSRYDIGVFVATGGGDARTGSACYHDYFAPPLTQTPTYSPSATDDKVELVNGAWWDGDSDDCGDIEERNNGFATRSIMSLPSPSSTFTIACTDSNSDGNTDIDICLSWSGGTSNPCNNLSQAVPPSSTRCGCQRVEITGLAPTTTTTMTGATSTTIPGPSTTTTTLPPTGAVPIPARIVVIRPGRLFKIVAPHESGLPAGDPLVDGAVLSFSTTTGGQSYALPASCWSGDAVNGYQCSDIVCPTIRVRPDMLKAICRDDTGTFTVPNGGDVDVLLTIGDSSGYCANCGGEAGAGNPNRQYSRKMCAAPASCP
jgi:hypothetical protein